MEFEIIEHFVVSIVSFIGWELFIYTLCPVVDLVIETFNTYVDVLLYFLIVRSSFLFPSMFQSSI